jgi:hypothetical protein
VKDSVVDRDFPAPSVLLSVQGNKSESQVNALFPLQREYFPLPAPGVQDRKGSAAPKPVSVAFVLENGLLKHHGQADA